MTDRAYAVPLHEQLARVPRDARLVIDDPDGMGTKFIPVGRYCHEAAAELRAALANEFNPDWNQVEALQESLREHMAEIQRLRARLAQPEQEPVAWKMKGVPAFATSRPNDTDSIKWDALYTTPPQREWQGLTDEEIDASLGVYDSFGGRLDARKIEAKLKEKNYD